MSPSAISYLEHNIGYPSQHYCYFIGEYSNERHSLVTSVQISTPVARHTPSTESYHCKANVRRRSYMDILPSTFT